MINEFCSLAIGVKEIDVASLKDILFLQIILLGNILRPIASQQVAQT
jgi:hypothetical protein